MPVVFVHGVSVRREHDYYGPSEKTRDAMFRQLTLPLIAQGINPAAVAISNPYWGGQAATFAWNRASLPQQAVESFGTADDLLTRTAEEAVIELGAAPNQVDPSLVLTKLAREKTLARAIDVLWSSTGLAGEVTDSAEALAALGLKAQRYALANPQPPWLAQVASDIDFADKLLAHVEAWKDPQAVATSGTAVPELEAFGAAEVWNQITAVAGQLGTAAAAAVTNPIVQMVRPSFNEKLTLFFGDVFCYLTAREKEGANCPIVKTVSDAFVAAHAKRSAADPLIIVGHSMGGNISYDLLTHFLKDKVECDLLLTVGSQVALFEELKLYVSSDPAIRAPQRVARPPNVKRWINVFDRADVFSYQSGTVFKDVDDYEYPTGETVAQAHGAYLLQPRFHMRLNARIRRLP